MSNQIKTMKKRLQRQIEEGKTVEESIAIIEGEACLLAIDLLKEVIVAGPFYILEKENNHDY